MTAIPELISDLLARLGRGDFTGIRELFDRGELEPLRSHFSETDWAALPGRLDAQDAGWLRERLTGLGSGVAGAVGAAAGAVTGLGAAAATGLGSAVAGATGLGAAATGAGPGGFGSDGGGGGVPGWVKWGVPAVVALGLVGFGLSRLGGDGDTTASSSPSASTTPGAGSTSTGDASGAASPSSSVTEPATATGSATGAATGSGTTPTASSTAPTTPATATHAATSAASATPSAVPSAPAAGTADATVYFDTASAVIRPDAAAVIRRTAPLVTAGTTVRLTGFADQRGTVSGNLALSRRRAEAVKAALVKAGAKATYVVSAKGVATGSDLQRARRVEIDLP